jgi:hypothetical protein
VAKSSNKESALSSYLLSQKAPQNERALPPLAKELAEIQPLLYIGPGEMTKVPYTRSYNTSPHRGILVNT